MTTFVPFPKMSRLFRDCVITEKIDGTNAQVKILHCQEEEYTPDTVTARVGDYMVLAGSRKRYVIPGDDNFGFAAWVKEHAASLVRILGPGQHFGEWWGRKIQRGYGKDVRLFSLFNTSRWGWLGDAAAREANDVPATLEVVPTLYLGPFDFEAIEKARRILATHGSVASLGFPNPEGMVIYHAHSNSLFKYTLDGDGHKGN